MKHSERFALNEWLSDYPTGLDFEDVLDQILQEDSGVVPYQLFENMPPNELINVINGTRNHFENVVDDLVWGVALSSITEEETEEEQERRG